MNKVIVDDELRAKLNGLDQDVELCDVSGQTIGYVLSRAQYESMVIAWANSQVSDEELKKLSEQRGGRTLKEIWKSLGAA